MLYSSDIDFIINATKRLGLVDDDTRARDADKPAGNDSREVLTKAGLLALVPLGSTVDYSTADRTICVVHDPQGGVIAILSDRSPGPVARRAQLIACIPRLIEGCTEAVLAEVLSHVAKLSDGSGALWGYTGRVPPNRVLPPPKS